MPSAIDPDKIPGKDIDPDAIETNASTIKTIAGSVRDNGSNVHLKWQGMAGVYEAPESGTLLGLMQPVSSQATAAGDNLEVVAGALTQFAADVRPIKAELDSLRLQAQAFRDEIAGGVQVQEVNPAWVSTQGYYGTTSSYAGYSPYSSSSTGGSATPAADIPQYHSVTKEWHEVQEYVDRNNDLISQVNAQQVAMWEAERTCANTIRALFGGAPLHAYESEDDPLGYGLNEIPEGTEMPWGAPVERSEGCGEATAKFVFKDFLWEGVIVGGVWGTIEGLGTLVLGYNPATGDWFSGDAYGAAWGNLGLLAASGVMNSPLLGPLMWADQGMEAFGGGGFLPQEVRDFKAKADEAALNTGKALIAWDKWADDPGTALGESVFNVGTILIPGGAAVTGVKTAGTAASVLSKMARVVDLVDPASLAINGTVRLGGLGIRSLDNMIGTLDLGSKLDAPHIEVYTATDTASAIKALDDWGVDMNTVTAHIDGAGNNVLEFPGGRIELPAGSFDNAGGGVRAGDGGADASVTAPVREPELVNAGGVRGETGPGAVNAVVDEAPVRTETGGSGESTIVRDPETTTGGGDGPTGYDGSSSGGDTPGTGGDTPGSAGGSLGDEAGGIGDHVDDQGSVPGSGSSATSPDRIYSMMDGVDHASTFAPEQLGPSRITNSLLQSHGVTHAQFVDLINRPIGSLTATERGIVNSIRDSLTAQLTPDTVFQKVMDQPHFEVAPDGSSHLVFGQAENMVLRDTTDISGSISVADDTAHLATPRDFFEALRLDYPGTNFATHDGSAFVVRFQADTATGGSISPQLHSSMGGNGSVDHYSPPFTGNGFLAAADDILPEYRASKVAMREGAEVWEVLDDGTQRLFAVLRGGEWIPQGL